MFTRASVVCADRMVAVSSSKALVWSSSQIASGYISFRRRLTSRVRLFGVLGPATGSGYGAQLFGSVSRVLSVRVSNYPPGTHQSSADVASAKLLVGDAAARLGFRPLSDQGWVDLVHGAATSIV